MAVGIAVLGPAAVHARSRHCARRLRLAYVLATDREACGLGKPYNGRGNRGIGSVSLDTALAGDFSDHRSGQQRL